MLRRALATAVTAATLLASPLAAHAALTGADVSLYQHPGGAGINWAAVKASGQAFVFHRVTGGTSYTDPTFAHDWRAAKAAGLIVGGYHYAVPSGAPGSAAAQARRFVHVLGTTRHPGELPPVLDLETTGGLRPAQLIAWTGSFLRTVHALTGRTAIVYSYPYFWRTAMAGTRAFHGYPLWGACYCSRPTTFGGAWPQWTFWQYSDYSAVRGIGARSDMNRFNGSLTQLRALANIRQGTVLTAKAPSAAPSGTAFTFAGALRNRAGRGVAGRQVFLSVRPTGATRWSPLAVRVTSATGAWSAPVTATHDVQVVAWYPGDAITLPSTSPTLTVHVTAPPAG